MPTIYALMDFPKTTRSLFLVMSPSYTINKNVCPCTLAIQEAIQVGKNFASTDGLHFACSSNQMAPPGDTELHTENSEESIMTQHELLA